ncbi:hypothetical protein CC2G_013416 [Coprinopsis cinerea AmutBmut pab1-1]|nr:hypothetical protein CC2G_013416 [Coprinopsis cinerea AmutBmut pab1-1]
MGSGLAGSLVVLSSLVVRVGPRVLRAVEVAGEVVLGGYGSCEAEDEGGILELREGGRGEANEDEGGVKGSDYIHGEGGGGKKKYSSTTFRRGLNPRWLG